jgi:hypothetical protein
MWADSLKSEEVTGTLDAADQLGSVAWAMWLCRLKREQFLPQIQRPASAVKVRTCR